MGIMFSQLITKGVAMLVIRILSEIMALGALVAAIGLTCIGLGG